MKIRQPAVAGSFYPAEPGVLAAEVDRYLTAGRARLANAGAEVGKPKAIIAPHAGYIYSGPIAGTAYAAAAPHGTEVERVVLLGPAHRAYVDGLAATTADFFATPLGKVPVDRAAVSRALGFPQVTVSDAAHAAEHSLEVHLPFLQRVFPRATVVPFAVGGAPYAAVAEVIDALWGGGETLVVVSSDLSHYFDYATANRLDATTARAIEDLRPEALGSESACGRIPAGGLLLTARRRGLRARLLDLRNSGDTAGGRDEVVGYGAFVFC